MSLKTNFGTGFVFKAEEKATPVFRKVGAGFGKLIRKIVGGSNAMSRGMAPMAVGFGMLSGGKKITDAVDNMTDAASNFDQNLVAVGNIASATSKELVKLERSALKAAASTQFSPDQAIEGLKNLTTAGLNVAQSTTALIPVLDLATGSMGDLGLAEAANAVIGTVKAMGYEVNKSAIVTDKLLKITHLTNFQTRDFEVGLSRAASTAKLYEQNLDDTLITMGLLRNLNIEASVASTSLREAWRRMATDKRAQKGIEEYVQIFEKGTDKIRPMIDVMSELAVKTAHLTEKKRMALLTTSFGVRGMATFNAVASAQSEIMVDGRRVVLKGADAIKYLQKQTANATGTARKFRIELLDTYAGQKQLLEGLKSTIKVLIGQGGTLMFKPILEFLVKLNNGIVDILMSLSKETRGSFLVVLKSIGYFISSVGGIMLVVAALGMLGITLSGVIIGLAGLALFMGPAIVLFSGFAVAAMAIYEAFKQNIGGMGMSWKDLLKNIKLGMKVLVELFTAGKLSTATNKELEKAGKPMIKFAAGLENFYNKFKVFWRGLKEGFREGVAVLGPELQALKAEFKGFFDLFDDDKTTQTLDVWKEKGKSAGNTLASFGKTGLKALTSITKSGKGVMDWLSNLTASEISEGIEKLKTGFESIVGVFSGLYWFGKKLAGAFILFYEILSSIVDMDLGKLGALLIYGPEHWKESNMGSISKEVGHRTKAEEYTQKAVELKDWITGKGKTIEGGTTFANMSSDKQDDFIGKLDALNKHLAFLGSQPVILKVGEKELARANRKGEQTLQAEEVSG